MLVMTDLIDEIKTRYLVTQGGSLDATDTQVDYWIRQAAQFIFTVLPPIKLAELLVASDRTATLPQLTSRVFFVARGPSLLFPHQWAQHTNLLHLKPNGAANGDELAVWYQPRFNISTATEFDTDSVLGDDWGKEIILVRAGMQLQRRDSKRSPGRGGTKEAQSFRVDQADHNELYAMMKAQWDGFFQEMRDKLQTRLAFNDVPMRDSPLEGFRNDALVVWPHGAPGSRVP